MKRVGNLFPRIVDRENLRSALARALRGKRCRPETRQFTANLEQNLLRVQSELIAGNVCLGRYHQFVIHDPKQRTITAPAFEERIIHHAVMNICEPVFERWLIDDTFACRVGKGRVKALKRATKSHRRYRFFLKLDIRKYFDSISHDELLKRLTRLFKDHHLLDLFERIVRSYSTGTGLGLPIGSLMSQHFANFYLGWFDRHVKEIWRVKGYARYMDDMLIWSDSKQVLRGLRDSAREYLSDQLQLDLKDAGYLNRCEHGVDFLGCRLYPWGLKLNRRSRQRFRKKIRGLEEACVSGRIDESTLQSRVTALVAFTQSAEAKSWQLRKHVIKPS